MKYLKVIIAWENSPWEIGKRLRDFGFPLTDTSNRGFLLTIVTGILWLLDVLSIYIFCRIILGSFGAGRRWLNRKFHIEVYVLIWISGEIAILYFLRSSNDIFFWLVLLRLVDIVQSQYRLSFIREKPDVIPARSLILVILNYAEIIMIYAIIGFIKQHHFVQSFTFKCIYDSLEYSIRVFVPLIPINIDFLSQIPTWGKVIFYSEIICSLFTHILIVQRVLSFFRK